MVNPTLPARRKRTSIARTTVICILGLALLNVQGSLWKRREPSASMGSHLSLDLVKSDAFQFRKEAAVAMPPLENAVQSKIIVMSVWTHYPELMQLHVATIRAFLNNQTPVDYIAILNSRNETVNAALAHTADSLNVAHLLIEHNFETDASKSHGNALNTGMNFLLHPESPIPLLGNDILFLLDSDIFLTSPTDLSLELDDGQILSMSQQRHMIHYLWPNFAAFRFPNRGLYGELDFRPAVAIVDGEHIQMDSGGSTSLILAHHPELKLVQIRSAQCSYDTKRPLCHFFHQQRDEIPRDNICMPPELLEYSEREEQCRQNSNSTGCLHHATFYHLGSAGSNWRGCPEEYLLDRRKDLIEYIVGALPTKVREDHFLAVAHEVNTA